MGNGSLVGPVLSVRGGKGVGRIGGDGGNDGVLVEQVEVQVVVEVMVVFQYPHKEMMVEVFMVEVEVLPMQVVQVIHQIIIMGKMVVMVVMDKTLI